MVISSHYQLAGGRGAASMVNELFSLVPRPSRLQFLQYEKTEGDEDTAADSTAELTFYGNSTTEFYS